MTIVGGAEPTGPVEFLLAFADDEHLMGQRHTEWIGVGPFLEEDMAFASIGQDELGHAAALYELALEVAGVLPDDADDRNAAVDALALRREPSDYRSCWLVEHPGADWAEALVRHAMYDEAERLRWEACVDSALPHLAALAGRALREESYHRRHAAALIQPLLADEQAGARLRAAAAALAPLGDAVFEPVAGEAAAHERQWITRSSDDMRAEWRSVLEGHFGSLPWLPAPAQTARTQRSEHFDELYGRMREVIVLDADARW